MLDARKKCVNQKDKSFLLTSFFVDTQIKVDYAGGGYETTLAGAGSGPSSRATLENFSSTGCRLVPKRPKLPKISLDTKFTKFYTTSKGKCISPDRRPKMAIPPTTIVWPESMDPYDVVDYTIDVSNLLEANESIASYVVSLPAESVLVGLSLGVNEYGSTISSNIVRVWFSTIKPNDPAFDYPGTTLPVEITVTTTATPPRKKQRTLGVKVVQR